MIKKTIYESILKANVYFLNDCSHKEVEEWIKKKTKRNGENYDNLSGSVTFIDVVKDDGRKSRDYLIVVEDKKDFYALLHEVTHLVTHILCDRGIPYTRENTESIAYFTTWWFKRLWRIMNK